MSTPPFANILSDSAGWEQEKALGVPSPMVKCPGYRGGKRDYFTKVKAILTLLGLRDFPLCFPWGGGEMPESSPHAFAWKSEPPGMNNLLELIFNCCHPVFKY